MDQYELKSKSISRELRELSTKLENEGIKDFHNQARCTINKKYGKGWRSELDLLSINNHPENHIGRFDGMSY